MTGALGISLAHGPISPATLWGAWDLEWPLFGGVVASAVLYRRGRRAAEGRGGGAQRAAAFYTALAVLLLALASPLHALGETLVSAHMVQHLVLVLAAAPLAVFGAPHLVWLGLPHRARRLTAAVGRARPVRAVRAVVASAAVVWALHAAAMWTWHLPSLYDRAVRSAPLHALEHAAFFGTALLFWAAVRARARSDRGAAPGAAVALVFATGLQSGILGALLVFAARPLYEVAPDAVRAWSLGPLADQQLAGLLMWVPAGAVYVVAIAVVFVRWLRALDEATARRPAQAAGGERP